MEVLNLNAFLQRNADGSSFVSCSGEVDGVPVEFTCNETDIVPVSTGTLFAIKDNASRFGVQIAKTSAIVLVGIKPVGEPHDVNGVAVQKVRFSRMDYITRPVQAPAWNIAAKRPAAQSQATGAIA